MNLGYNVFRYGIYAMIILIMFNAEPQNVGVGASSPTAKFHIDVPSTYTQDLFRISIVGNTKFVVKNNGFVGVLRPLPTVPLHVGGGADITPTSGGYLQVGGDAQHVVIDDNEIMSRSLSSGTATDLYLNADGGKVHFHFHVSGNQSVFDPNVGLGIGTLTPTQRLDVRGNFRLEGAFMPANSAGNAGDILVSGGAGSAPAWQTPGPGFLTPLCATASSDFIQKWTGAALCNSAIYEDPNTGNVGIHTTTPFGPFEIEDTPGVNGQLLTLDAVGPPGANAGIFFDAITDAGANYNTGLIVADAGNGGTSPRLRFMVIDDDGTGWDTVLSLAPQVGNSWGKVGISTDNPQHDLHVEGTVDMNYLWPGLGDGTQYRFVRLGDPSQFWGGIMWNNTNAFYGDGDDVVFYSYDNGTGGRDIYLVAAGSNAKVVAKTPNSNWAFMIQNPNGWIRMSPANTSGAHIYTSNPKFYFNRDVWVGVESGAGTPDVVSSYCDGATGCTDGRTDLVLATHGNERIRILHSNGNVGIGTSTPPTKLAVAGLTAGTGSTLVYDPATGGIYYQASSAQQKKDIKPFSDQWNKVLSLEPKQFTYKESGHQSIGYLAEQLDSLGLKAIVQYDQNGNPISINYQLLSIYTIELLKEYNQRITELENLVRQLQMENSELKANQSK
ncbi:MAG: hypothetical protein GXO48_04920 [Chlorobi bacterium]|nr:hypothetical protein [Chlorobiota bacterium]